MIILPLSESLTFVQIPFRRDPKRLSCKGSRDSFFFSGWQQINHHQYCIKDGLKEKSHQGEMNHMERQRVREPESLTFGGVEVDIISFNPITFILEWLNETTSVFKLAVCYKVDLQTSTTLINNGKFKDDKVNNIVKCHCYNKVSVVTEMMCRPCHGQNDISQDFA